MMATKPTRPTKTKTLRKTSEAVKKIVAARQNWTCHVCREILKSAYEIDHVQPLWQGGADDRENMMALCASCHAQKTQAEHILRAEETRSRRVELRENYEAAIQREEEGKREQLKHASGTVLCMDCQSQYYPVFAHKCRQVAARVEARIGRPTHINAPAVSNLFSEFYFINQSRC